MYKILICDDSREYTRYNCVMLDLNLGDMSGYEVARYYREIYPKGVIVFCSGVYSPIPATFEYMPYRFIEKGQKEEKTIEYINDVIEYLNRNQKEIYLIGHKQMNVIRVRADNIEYITNQINGRGSIAHLFKRNEENNNIDKVMLNEKLNTLYEKLSECGFEYINKRCLINMDYIKSLGSSVIMRDGMQLNVSRSAKKQLNESYIKYIKSKM